MTAVIPEAFLDLFKKRAFAHFATVMADGTPQVTPVWVDYDGEYVLVNSRMGRTKNRNVQDRPAVAIEISDPDNPYRYLMIRGTVVAIETVTDGVHIDALTQRYLGLEHYPWGAPDEVREIFKIRPEHVVTRVITDVPKKPVG